MKLNTLVNLFKVCKFGDLSMGKMTVGEFQGPKESANPVPFPPSMKGCGASAVSGPEVPVTVLQKTIEHAESEEEANEAREKLASLQKNRDFMKNVVRTVVHSVTANSDLTDAVFNDNVELTQ